MWPAAFSQQGQSQAGRQHSQTSVVFEYADRNIKNQSASSEVHVDSITTPGQGQEAVPEVWTEAILGVVLHLERPQPGDSVSALVSL